MKVANVPFQPALSAAGVVAVRTTVVKVGVHVGVELQFGVAGVRTEVTAVDRVRANGEAEHHFGGLVVHRRGV